MSIKSKIKKFLNIGLNKAGFEIERINHSTMDHGLNHAAQEFPKINSIIDIGAARGEWGVKARTYFPDTKILMVEALKEREFALAGLAFNDPKMKYVITAVAPPNQDTVTMIIPEDLDGAGIADGKVNRGERERIVPGCTIDKLISIYNLEPPYLLKFDTHWLDHILLHGATEALKQTKVIVMECYMFEGCKDRMLFPEMCLHMKSLGFRLFNIVELIRREDGMLWQVDAFFARSDWWKFKEVYWK